MSDPKRWADDPRAPKGTEELLSSIDAEPRFDEVVRSSVRSQLMHATSVPMTPRLMWRAPVIGATAIVLAGIVLWRFSAVDESHVELRPDVAAEVDRTVIPEQQEIMPAASNQSTVVVTSEPVGAEIFVDGVLRGITPLQLTLAEGTYAVEARLAGYVEARVSHRVVAGERSRLALALAQAHIPVVRTAMEARAPRMRAPREPSGERHTATGTLVVNTNPWSRVYVDGRLIGNTPITRHVLSVGRHRIRLETASGVVETVVVTIREGQRQRLIRRL